MESLYERLLTDAFYSRLDVHYVDYFLAILKGVTASMDYETLLSEKNDFPLKSDRRVCQLRDLENL